MDIIIYLYLRNKLTSVYRNKLIEVRQQDLPRELQQELTNETMYSDVLYKIVEVPLSRKEISEAFGQKQVSGQLEKILSKLADDKLIEHTIPEIKNHPNQKLLITKRGITFL